MSKRQVGGALCACAVTTLCAMPTALLAQAQPDDAGRVYTEEELFPPELQHHLGECTVNGPDLAGRDLYVNRLWPNGIVRYEFAPDVSNINRQRTLFAMAEISAVCQVTFVERDEEPDFIYIVDQSAGGGNNASLGYTGTQQHLGIQNWGSKSTIIHETLHGLGFQHEQKRPDRDQFITVHFENIIPAYQDQYSITQSGFMHGPYDYFSVMHYGPWGFSNGRGPTFDAPPEYAGLIGTGDGLSEGDIEALVFLYGGAATAPNDNCANAVPIVGEGLFVFDNSAASEDGPADPGCPAFSDGIDNDVWFTWTASITGPTSVSTCGQTDVNTRIAVYQGTACPSGSALSACSDDSCGAGFEQAQANFTATAGQQYLIRVGTPPDFAGGVGTFTIDTQIGGVPNDNCLTPSEVTGFGTFAFDSSSATTDGFGTESCNFFSQPNMERDVWFSWTSPITGEITASTCGETSIDSKISVLAGSCGGDVVACADDACESLLAEVRFNAVEGQTYLIRVGSHPGTPGGEGVLTIDDRPPPPANDACFDAETIGLGQTPFSTISASTDGPLDPALCIPRADIWYLFSAQETGDYTLSTSGSDFNTVLLVYEGDVCGGASEVLACNDDASGITSEVTITADAGSTYLIRLGGSEMAQGTGVLSINPAAPACPCDLVENGAVDVFDLLAYLDLWFVQDAAADIDGAAGVDVFDLLSYLDCWFAGC